MKPTQPKSTPARGAAWILGAPTLAIVATFVLALADAAPDESGADWIGAAWLAAVLWTIAASFVQALWQGLRHGDWSAFTCCDLPGNDEDLDWATKTGKYAHMRIRATHEDLMREGERFLEDHDHGDSCP